MPNALLLENIHPVAIEVLSSAGYEVESLSGALGEDAWSPPWTAFTCSGSGPRPR
jgi:hypothetical protein